MKILIVTRELPPIGGGAGNVAMHLAEQLAELGNHISIVTMHYGDLPLYEHRDKITIHRIRCGRKNQDSSYLIEMLRFVFAARPVVSKITRIERWDIIHAHAIVPDGIIALAASRRARCPFVLTAHGSDVPGYNPDYFQLSHVFIRNFWSRVIDAAGAVVAPSRYLTGLIQRVRPNLPVVLIPNGVPIGIFKEHPKDTAFLIVSRLVRRKNYQLFLKALRDIRTPQVVHIVGDGPMLTELKELATDVPQHEVHFHGWLVNGSPEWCELYESCRFFVFPSESENFPINLLEAQLARMVILASDIPGNREVLGNNAVYFKSLDASGVSRALMSVISCRPEEWDAMTMRAKSRVLEKYSWQSVSLSYLKLFQRTVQRTSQADAAHVESQ